MQARDIPVEAYAPLAVGEVMQDPTLKDIAAAHGTSAAAVSVAWILSKPLGVAIPKTAKKERLAQNLGFANLTLTAEDIARIDALSRPDGRMVAPDGLAPDWD
nr:aldo/keto reductase [Sulfitobacter sp.]